jgi:two-component system, sensor histidine kinase PdtaS
LVFLSLRVALTPVAGDRAPYAFVFLSIVAACVLAGWRSGLVALALGQAWAWYFIVTTDQAPGVPEPVRLWGGLITATISQLLILSVVALYQREVGRAMAAQEREMDLLSEALKEIDHRTRNNYQTVVALILLQAQRGEDPNVKRALAEAADRVRAVSLASDQLALRSEDLGTIRLGDHLRELCAQIKRGLAGDEVLLRCDIADLTARAETAIHLSIIVNELVTNALKHAFDDSGGEIRITCEQAGEGVELVIADNGSGMKAANAIRSGLGSRLVERFVKELDAKHEVSTSAKGTTHRIVVHHLA